VPIPKTRSELIKQISSTYEQLQVELERVGPQEAKLLCVDDWSIKDLLAVRVWWVESLLKWIELGKRGQHPLTPAPGYKWKETPRLNADIVHAARKESYRRVRARLDQSHKRTLATIERLSEKELMRKGAFEWTGTLPLFRWISINTARQYTTARTYVRRALRREGGK
jgi:hypothetical protein